MLVEPRGALAAAGPLAPAQAHSIGDSPALEATGIDHPALEHMGPEHSALDRATSQQAGGHDSTVAGSGAAADKRSADRPDVMAVPARPTYALPAVESGGLPVTGAQLAAMVLYGGVLVGAGAALMAAARRRS